MSNAVVASHPWGIRWAPLRERLAVERASGFHGPMISNEATIRSTHAPGRVSARIECSAWRGSSTAVAKVITSVCVSVGLSPCVRPSRRSVRDDPGTATDRGDTVSRNSVDRVRTESASDHMASA